MNFFSNIGNGYKNLSGRKYFYLFASIPWVIFILLLTRYLLNKNLIYFQYNDDFYMSMIVGGSFGEPSPFTVFNNILLGWIMVFLTKIAPAHNWFLLIQLAVIVFSYMALGVWNINKNKLVTGYLSSLVFVLATLDSVLCRVSFTKTGALPLAVGSVFLTSSLLSEDWKKLSNRLIRILGYLMIFFGGLFRENVTLASIPFAVLLLVFVFQKVKKDRKARLIAFASVFVLLLFSWIGHHVVYKSTEDWRFYTDFNNACGELVDYYVPNYDDYTLELQEYGITRLDYRTLTSYQFADADVFSIEYINTIIDFRDTIVEKEPLSERISNTFAKLIDKSSQYYAFYIALFFFFALLCLGDKKNFFYQLIAILMGIGELWLLIYKGRMLEHVFFMALIYAFVSMLAFYEADKTQKYIGFKAVLLFALIGIFAYYSCGFSSIKYCSVTQYDSGQADEILAYTAEHSDKLFVMDIDDNYSLLGSAYSSFFHPSEIPHSNITFTGCWLTHAPFLTDNIAPFGDKYNVFELMATNEDVYWISKTTSYRTQLLEYLQTHYNPNAELTIVEEIGDYYVLSVSSK